MKDDLEHRAEAVVPVISRRNFIGAAAAAGVASIVPAGLGSLSSKGSAMKVEQFVLPTPTKDVTPFKIHVPQAALDDLKKKLADARWPDKETVADWSQGVPLARAQALVENWRTRYDWRRVESSLNALPQFRTQIDGLGIYFIHLRSKHENALPIILTHGWPGSIIEFLQVIGPLTDPTAHGGKADEAFHV
ncbi:MAG TPA: epoxide hydrolase N-terminal domain-containing protein, partial [Terriglobales bacterium]|nr:epoxide hydrolase N-terminal domain-containing protein [Terriglobales bacterium]